MAIAIEAGYESVLEEAPQMSTLEDLLRERSDGVRPYEARVRLTAPLEAFPNHNFLGYLYGAVGFVDSQMNAYPEKLTDLFKEKYSILEVVSQQQRYVSEFQRILVDDYYDRDNVVIATPMYGALPIMERLKEVLGDRFDVLPAWISGTTGATTGEAQVIKTLDPRLLDEKKTVILADDVTDSCVSLATLALERQKVRQDGKVDQVYVDMLREMQRLKDLDPVTDYSDDAYIVPYQRLAQLLEKEHIVIAPFYNKNKPVLSEIIQYASHGEIQPSIWTSLQADFSSIAVDIGQREWIMGGQGDWEQPLLDTGINGAHKGNTMGMLDYIEKKYHQHLINMGFDKLYLRIGAGIKNLVVFEREQYNNLVEILAKLVTAYMEKNFPQKE